MQFRIEFFEPANARDRDGTYQQARHRRWGDCRVSRSSGTCRDLRASAHTCSCARRSPPPFIPILVLLLMLPDGWSPRAWVSSRRVAVAVFEIYEREARADARALPFVLAATENLDIGWLSLPRWQCECGMQADLPSLNRANKKRRLTTVGKRRHAVECPPRLDLKRKVVVAFQVECIWPVASTGPVGAPVGDPPGGSSDTASTACAFICATISAGSDIVAG
ncbi:hypothetical protein AWB77_04291 [Caballeronia fortuita]|uniref:Uncharacterized protein n=1 Tax=Caballeronia fortuita TaxID=1777138 RepID=A0A158CMB3_9BURK|nr:hypothetical protein AWB77_04291 [Caballeronia fortuita]